MKLKLTKRANGNVYHDEELVRVTSMGHELLTPRHHWKKLYVIE